MICVFSHQALTLGFAGEVSQPLSPKPPNRRLKQLVVLQNLQGLWLPAFILKPYGQDCPQVGIKQRLLSSQIADTKQSVQISTLIFFLFPSYAQICILAICTVVGNMHSACTCYIM